MYNKMEFKKVKIDDFIKKHTHINYCEAIIYPDGDITYAAPSHQQALISITGKSMDNLFEIMAVSAAPTEWLIDYTGCICVWFQGFKMPDGSELFYREEEVNGIYLSRTDKIKRYKYTCSKEQISSLSKLIESNLILNNNLRY